MIRSNMNYYFKPLPILVALLMMGSPLAAEPAASPWAETDQTSVRLISAANAVGSARELSFGLHFTMRPGWKIYWRSPGDAGYPPTLDWTGSDNLKSASLRWPLPHRFAILGLQSIGYKDEVVLPMKVVPENPGQPVRLRALVDFLTCSDICVPMRLNVAMDLPAGSADPSEFARLINRYSVQVPGDGSGSGVRLEKAEVIGGGKDYFVRITATADLPFEAPDLFVEGPNVLVFDKPSVRFSNASPKGSSGRCAGRWRSRL